ncbi:hypothetical protein pb186bvf_016045 [Paramecium bursaria]
MGSQCGGEQAKVPMITVCPTDCQCGGSNIKYWYHDRCNTQCYISSKGCAILGLFKMFNSNVKAADKRGSSGRLANFVYLQPLGYKPSSNPNIVMKALYSNCVKNQRQDGNDNNIQIFNNVDYPQKDKIFYLFLLVITLSDQSAPLDYCTQCGSQKQYRINRQVVTKNAISEF